MAIKYTPAEYSDIPTLTEVVNEKDDTKKNSVNGTAAETIHPKFEKVLEKLIQKKLQQEIPNISQAVAADIMAELQKQLARNKKSS